ncbi:MAG: protein kinase [Proteobacteria bacterium]|nr:protein kinase [Pseudomonadota bacterium]
MAEEREKAPEETSFTDNLSVKSFLGQGGVGRVFLGFERNLEREVAIKEIIPGKLAENREKKIARFVREARLAGQLQHPGIIPVYSLARREDGTYYYVMKRVQGRTLAEAIKDSVGMSEEESFARRMALLDNVIAVCDAMGYAHSRGIVHRDLKPSNIVIGEFGETIILDWGLAKRVDEREAEEPGQISGDPEIDADAKLTRDGAIVGTPAYLAPEQILRDAGPVDARTDVYTLGVMLFMLLAGRRPYLGDTRQVLSSIASPDPSPSPAEHCRCIPPELAAICRKAMAKERAERFADATELARELRAYRDGRLVSVYAYSAGELLRRFVSRNRAAIMAAAAVVAAIVAGAAFSLNFAVEAHRARQKAVGALVEVTNLSESSMELAREKSELVYRYFERLEDNMNGAASRLAAAGSGDRAGIRSALERVMGQHPEAASFYFISPLGETIGAFPGDLPLPAEAATKEIAYLRGLRGEAEAAGEELGVHTLPSGRKAFSMSVPVMKGGSMAGGLVALMFPDTAIPFMLQFDPRESEYQVWIMKEDGLLVYDEDPRQVGLYLFTDEMYRSFPELLKFGEKIKADPWGVGHYSFLEPDNRTTVYKVAAWDTLRSDGTEWKLVVTHPYISE